MNTVSSHFQKLATEPVTSWLFIECKIACQSIQSLTSTGTHGDVSQYHNIQIRHFWGFLRIPPVKTEYRLVKKTTQIGNLKIKAGTTVMVVLAAMNRDPRVFEQPEEIQLNRKNSREHVAFGRGVHACAGSPLARAESRISLECIFDRLPAFGINAAKHGPEGARCFEYEPTYTLRGLIELHLDFTVGS